MFISSHLEYDSTLFQCNAAAIPLSLSVLPQPYIPSPPLHMIANPSAKPIRLNCMGLHSSLHDAAELIQEVVLLEQGGCRGDSCLTRLSFDPHRVWRQIQVHKDLLVGLKAEDIH